MSGFEQGQKSVLGEGVPGMIPKSGFANTLIGSDVALKRKVLRRAFKSNKVSYVDGSNTVQNLGKSMCGPFRSAFQLGDRLGRQNLSCGGCNQINDPNSSIMRSKMIDAVSSKDCGYTVNGATPLNVPLSTCNTKFVADSSLYTRFKHLNAVNQTYNDSSLVGDNNNGSYTFLRSFRR